MLDDKDYMRRQPHQRLLWPMTAVIVALNVLIYIVQNAFDQRHGIPGHDAFILNVEGLKHGRIWQLLTFQFLHAPLVTGGIIHLLGNCFIIYVFGRRVEKAIGSLRFLALYLVGGALGGLLQMATGLFLPEHFGQSIIGASAGAFALLAAYAAFSPGQLVHMFFLPFGIRADILFALTVLGALIGLFVPAGHVAHVAHLGGLFWGYVFARKVSDARIVAPPYQIAKGWFKLGTVQE